MIRWYVTQRDTAVFAKRMDVRLVRERMNCGGGCSMIEQVILTDDITSPSCWVVTVQTFNEYLTLLETGKTK